MLNKIGIFTFLLALGLTWAGNGTFFYGLIDAAALRRLCITAGFEVIESGHIKELAYVLCTRDRTGAAPLRKFSKRTEPTS
jgi:hypothetical protein